MAYVLILIVSRAYLFSMAEEQCGGKEPVTDLLYGVSNHYNVASNICCHNHRYAERAGFLQQSDIRLFDKIDKNSVTVFYDSVCGKPLFVAPKGRSFEEFKRESIAHGWPSFRPEETVNENVIIHSGGRMESICGTHLGHNLPDNSGARYCIDLVCVSHKGGSGNSTVEGFDPDNFESKVDNPGQTLPTMTIVLIVVGVLAVVGLIVCAVMYLRKARRAPKEPVQQPVSIWETEAV